MPDQIDPPDQAYMDPDTGTISYGKETPEGAWQLAVGNKEEIQSLLQPITEFSMSGRKVPDYDPSADHARIASTMAQFYRKISEQQQAQELTERMGRKRGRHV